MKLQRWSKTALTGLVLLLSIGIVVTISGIVVSSEEFAGGSGTEEDPYLIETAEHLDNVRNYLDKHFKQTDEIDLTNLEEDWNPIGDNTEQFSGAYDGGDFLITGLTINQEEFDYVGLFGFLGEDALIESVYLKDYDIVGTARGADVGALTGRNNGKIILSYAVGNSSSGEGGNIGGLVGDNDRTGSIIDSFAKGDIKADKALAGGLVGWNRGGEISNSYAVTNLSGNEASAGGLIGSNAGDISNSFSSGEVTGSSPLERLGGLVGTNIGNIVDSYSDAEVTGYNGIGGLVGRNIGEISNSYAWGDVTGINEVGGLVGINYYEHFQMHGKVSHSYASGKITGEEDVGGLIGYNLEGEIDYSFYDETTSGQTDEDKGMPKSSEDMMKADTFEEWDFETIWFIDEGEGYPYLQWENDDQK